MNSIDFNRRYYEMKNDSHDTRSQKQVDADFEAKLAADAERQAKIDSGEIVLKKSRPRKPTAKQIERREAAAVAQAAKVAEREAKKAALPVNHKAIKKASRKLRAYREQGDAAKVAEFEAKIAVLRAAQKGA